jgi:hypothetical protein
MHNAERQQYQRDMRRATEIMDRMRDEDPAAWREYRSELSTFEAVTAGDGLTDAASEWPEYDEVGRTPTAEPGR